MLRTRARVAIRPHTDAGSAIRPNSRAVRRRKVREELVNAAWTLFRERGFDAVTTNEIADAVGLSRRSFFRYFTAKEDLVFHWLTEQGEFVLPILRDLAATATPLDALKHTFLELADLHDAQPELTHFRTHLIFDTASLSGRYHDEHARWEGRFMQVLARRQTRSVAKDLELRVQVAISITTFVVAIRSWADAAARDSLRPWVAKAFAAITPPGTTTSAAGTRKATKKKSDAKR